MDRSDRYASRPSAEQAAEWFVRAKDEKLSLTERRRYIRWLKRSPEHIGDVLGVKCIYSMLRRAKVKTLPADDDFRSNVVEGRFPLDDILRGQSLLSPARKNGKSRVRRIAAALSRIRSCW